MKNSGTLLLLLLFALSLSAQRYSFKNFTTNDGLVQTDITDIKQDKKGNIWIGTNGGISVFDGKTFTNYDDHDLLQSLRINALLCDSNGTVWIATRNGLLRYQNGFEVFFKPATSHKNFVSCLTLSSKNQLLFVCNSTVYEVKNNRAEKYRINDEVENKTAFVAFDRDDQLWIVTEDLRVYRKVFKQLTPIRTPFTAAERKGGLGMMRVLGKEGPEPYFVTNFGALRVVDDSLHYFVQQFPGYADARVGQATYVLQENDSTVWVGGVVGMAKLTGSGYKRFTAKEGFCDNSVSCLFTDRERNLWVGCTYNGVYKLSNEALFQLLPSNQSFDLRHVSTVVPLSPRKTLMGTWGKGLYAYNGDSVARIPLPPQLRYITTMLTVGNDTYVGWFGPGLWRLNNSTHALSRVAGFAGNEAVAMLQKAGPNLVVQTLDNTCYVTDQTFRVKTTKRLPENFYLTVVKDRIYAVSPFGEVDALDETLNAVRKNLFPEITSRITEITTYRDNFLIGTFGQGIFLYNAWGKLLRRLDKKSGLNTNIVTSLLVDGNQLYIGSNLGLIKTDLPELCCVKVFKESEGMFNWECRPDGLRKLPGGGIFISTTNGPYLYHPAQDPSQQYASGVLSVADIRYGQNGDKAFSFLPFDRQIKLPDAIDYKDNRVTIALKGVSQRSPDDVQYHYQLSGFDSMWVTTADPLLVFDALPPGAYKLKAYLTVGGFQGRPLSVAFSVARPLSGRLWFQVMLVLVLSGICWVLLTVGNRIYQKYVQTKMVTKLEADVARKQQLTAQAIGFARQQYKEFGETLRQANGQGGLAHLTPVFLSDVGRRIELLWEREKLTLDEFHRYFDELLTAYGTGARLYHKQSAGELEMPVPAAFQLLQFFSLYLFVGLYQSGTAVFSLDSENKSNGQLLLRIYNLTHEAANGKPGAYHLLKEAVLHQRTAGLTVDVIENLEFGNMIVAELNLYNEN